MFEKNLVSTTNALYFITGAVAYALDRKYHSRWLVRKRKDGSNLISFKKYAGILAVSEIINQALGD